MSDWRNEMTNALSTFVEVAKLANAPMPADDIVTEFCEAPHRPPSSLPRERSAIYGFWWNNQWLKIGQAGPNSQARYTSQHYNPASTSSTLADSLIRDPEMAKVTELDLARPGDWIRARCCRVNILIPSKHGKLTLSLLEAFLHVSLKPRYER